MVPNVPALTSVQPQRLLGSLLLNHEQGEASIPSRALVSLLEEFGVSEAGCRTALGRAVRRGWVERAVQGRHTAYRLTASGTTRIRDVEAEVDAFGPAAAPWDGTWRVVAFGIPEAERERRRRLRETLRAAGFAPLYDGVWVSPRREPAAVAPGVTVFRARSVSGDPARAWDLDGLAAAYRRYRDAFAPFASARSTRLLSGSEALRLRVAAFDGWRHLASIDPDLPREVLPASWPRPAAHEACRAVLDTSGQAAREHVRDAIRSAADRSRR